MMTNNNQELGHGRAVRPREPIDFDFLARQTFDDLDLQREVLGLFVAQVRDLVPALPRMPAVRQGEAAHRLSGSARGIGAWAAADAARAYEETAPEGRPGRYDDLARAFETAADAAAAARRGVAPLSIRGCVL